MKRAVFWVVAAILLAFHLAVAWPEDYMWCGVRQSGGVRLLGLSAVTNAHLELPSQSNYLYGVFCYLNGTTTAGLEILHLSNQTNAHAELNSSSLYPYPAGIGFQYGNVYCRYGNCNWYESCLLSLSNETNAHAEDCREGNYPFSVCCYAVDTQPPSISISSPVPNSTHSNSSSIPISLSLSETSYRMTVIFVENQSISYLPFQEISATTPDLLSGSASVSNASATFGVFGNSANISGNITLPVNFSSSALFVAMWIKGDGEARHPNFILNTSGFFISNGTWFSAPFPPPDGKWHFYVGYWNGSDVFTYFDASPYASSAGPEGEIDFSGDVVMYGWIDEFMLDRRRPVLSYMNKSLHTQHSEDVEILEEGEKWIYGFVQDMSGNTNFSEKWKYVYDITPPFVRIDEPANNSAVSLGVWINTTVYDLLSPLSVVELYINGSLFAENTTENASFFWNTSTYRNGPYNFTLRACDTAGNCNQTGIYTFIVNNSIIVWTAPEHEIDLDGEMTGDIWANATRNDGTPETNETARAEINFSATSYPMSWNGTHWTYEANASLLGLSLGWNNYSVHVINDSLDIDGWANSRIWVDDINISVSNLSSYYSFQQVRPALSFSRLSNSSSLNVSWRAELWDGGLRDSEAGFGSTSSPSLDVGCISSPTTLYLRTYANTSYLKEQREDSVPAYPRPMDLECGFEPDYLDWNFTDFTLKFWCRIKDGLNGTLLSPDSLSVEIVDPAGRNDCEGNYTLANFSWNPSLQRYEMSCLLQSTTVPDNCFDLTAYSSASKSCYQDASNTTSLVINCPPICNSIDVVPTYVDVDRTAEEHELLLNATDYDGYDDISGFGRKGNSSYQSMTKIAVSGPYNATFSLKLGHESAVTCFSADAYVEDSAGLTCSLNSSGCGENLTISVQGCNQTLYWGENLTINATPVFATDSSSSAGNYSCYFWNSTKYSEVTGSYSSNFSCTLEAPLVTEDKYFSVVVEANASRESVIDGRNDGCWVYVRKKDLYLDCRYPDIVDIGSAFQINCSITDTLGDPVVGATIQFNSSKKCQTSSDWQDLGDGNYTYSCLPEEPGLVEFNVSAWTSGYNSGIFKGSFFARYVERQETVELSWGGPGNISYLGPDRSIISAEELGSPGFCMDLPGLRSGILSLGRTILLRRDEKSLQEMEIGNAFVIPATQGSCSSVLRKMKTFSSLGSVTSPFSRIDGINVKYVISAKLPLPFSGSGKYTSLITIERTESGLRLVK